jgi:hypothetical protein
MVSDSSDQPHDGRAHDGEHYRATEHPGATPCLVGWRIANDPRTGRDLEAIERLNLIWSQEV